MSDEAKEQEGGGVPPPGGGRAGGEPGPAGGVRNAQRAWLMLLQGTLFLPFAVVKACGGSETEAFTGLGYYFAPERWAFGSVILVATVILLAWPWPGGRGAAAVAGLGVRAWVATVAAFVAVFGPFLAFLFDSPEPRVGWVLHGGGWALTALVGIGATIALLARGERAATRGPERRGVLTLVGGLVLAVGFQGFRHPEDLVPGALAMAGVGVAVILPLVLAGVALGRVPAGEDVGGTRRAWWAATAITVGTTLLAGVAD